MFNFAIIGIILVPALVAAIATIAVKKEDYRVARWMACGYFGILSMVGIVSIVEFLGADFPGPQWWWIRAVVTTAISVGLVFGLYRMIRWILALGTIYVLVGAGFSLFNWIQSGFRFGSFHSEVFLQWHSLWFFLIPFLMNLAMAWVLWRMFRWASDGGSAS